MKDMKEKISKKSNSISNNLEKIYIQLQIQENKFEGLAQKMGLDYSVTKITDTDLLEGIIQIKENMQNIIAKVQELTNEANLANIYNSLKELEKLTKASYIKDEHIQEIKEEFEKSFDAKIQELIRESKLSVLEKQKVQVQGEKSTFFERLLGKEKLKKAKLDNIDLKMQLLTIETHTRKLRFRLEDSLSDLYSYSHCELGRDLTDDMKQFLDVVKTDNGLRKMINWNELRKKFNEKVIGHPNNLQLVPVIEKKESFKNIANRIELQNDDMRMQIQNNRAIRIISKQNNKSKVEENQALDKFKNVIDSIKLSTMQHTDEKDKEQVEKNELQIIA